MRVVAITAPRGPEVLDVVERDVRAAGPGEVRIAVRAAAVNPTDIGLREHGAGDTVASRFRTAPRSPRPRRCP